MGEGKLVQYVLDLAVIVAALFGTLGSLYTAYAVFRKGILERFTAAATTGLAGALISGIAVGVPALDIAFSPWPGVISIVVGIVIWEAYGYFLFVVKAAPSFEALDDPKIDMSIPPWRRNQWQPAEFAAWLWFRIAVVSGAGWGEIAFLIAPQKGSLPGYMMLTMLLGGIGGAVYGYLAKTPENRPPYFSFKGLATTLGVITMGICALLLVVTAIIAYFTHNLPGHQMHPTLRTLLYIFILPIPVVIVALGFAPFARWRIYQLNDKQFGLLGILLILLAFLLQLIGPVMDMMHGLGW